MTATNHAVTGAAIALAIQNPWIALPAAFLSHFILDALPHFGGDETLHRKKRFQQLLMLDALGCFLIVLALVIAQPMGWFVAVVAAFLATSPDFMWASAYFRERRGLAGNAFNTPIRRFHKKIQWQERPDKRLLIVEVLWFALFAGFLSSYII
ncbi:MAG: hypothetical protein JWL85_878 [Candidatus Saccharibacteria bacterium]|nr:hypothetical protein [Candidatus Saccharibacteria bacterium]